MFGMCGNMIVTHLIDGRQLLSVMMQLLKVMMQLLKEVNYRIVHPMVHKISLLMVVTL